MPFLCYESEELNALFKDAVNGDTGCQALNPSANARRLVGIWGVAEPAATAGVRRIATPGCQANCPARHHLRCQERIHDPEDALMSGESNGKLLLVGLGPGDVIHQTPAAAAALSECDVLVGYRGYIDQLSGSLSGKELVSMELGQELERASRAVDLACGGRSVVVVSSGDAGIYGMAGPVFRVLTDREWDGYTPLVEVVPGISALQSAPRRCWAPH